MGKKKITRVILGTRNNLQDNDRTIFWLSNRYPGKCQKRNQITLVKTGLDSALEKMLAF